MYVHVHVYMYYIQVVLNTIDTSHQLIYVSSSLSSIVWSKVMPIQFSFLNFTMCIGLYWLLFYMEMHFSVYKQ